MTTTPARIDRPVPPSATLAINERIEQRIRDGADVLHLAFGEAAVPAAAERRRARSTARAGATSYGPVAGIGRGARGRRGVLRAARAPDRARADPARAGQQAAASTRCSRCCPATSSSRSRAGSATPRTPRSRASASSGSRSAPTPAACPTRRARGGARRREPHGARARRPRPHPPRQPDRHAARRRRSSRRSARIAERHGLLIVADEIYRDLAFDPGAFRGPADVVPERSFVTNGLSKNMALGGWRIGFARMADGPLGDEARAAAAGVAGAVWSALAAPMQAVAAPRPRRARRRRRADRRGAVRCTAPSRPPPTARSPPPGSPAGRRRAPSTSTPTSRPAARRSPSAASAPARTSPSTCSSATASASSRARRSATTRPACASAWRRASCTAPTTTSASGRSRATTRPRLPWIRAKLDRLRAALDALA